MNTTVRSLMRLQSIEAVGTSEGAKKGWEGRSRPPSGYGEDTDDAPQETTKLPERKANTSAPEGPPWYGAPRTTGYDKWFSEQRQQMKGHEGETSNFGTKHIAPLKAYGTSEGVKKEWDSRGRKIGQLQKEQDETKSWKDHATKGAEIEDVRHAPSGSGRARVADSGWTHHSTIGDNRPYHLYEGSGPHGGQWKVKEVRKSGHREIKVFNSRKEAENHIRHSQD